MPPPRKQRCILRKKSIFALRSARNQPKSSTIFLPGTITSFRILRQSSHPPRTSSSLTCRPPSSTCEKVHRRKSKSSTQRKASPAVISGCGMPIWDEGPFFLLLSAELLDAQSCYQETRSNERILTTPLCLRVLKAEPAFTFSRPQTSLP